MENLVQRQKDRSDKTPQSAVARPKRRFHLRYRSVSKKSFRSKKITALQVSKQNSKKWSFRAEQTDFFFLLRSCEVVGLGSRGISLRFIPRSTTAPRLRSVLAFSQINAAPPSKSAAPATIASSRSWEFSSRPPCFSCCSNTVPRSSAPGC